MESNKKSKNNMAKFIIAAILIALLVGAGVALANKKDDSSTSNGSMGSSGHGDGSQNEIVPNKNKSEAEKNIIDFTKSNEVEISVVDSAFKEQNIKIKKGTKVIWTNNDSIAHTVNSSGTGSDLSSGLFNNGETFEFVFNDVGVFDYHCEVHPFMEGSVTVIE